MRLSDRFFHMAGFAARARKCVFGAFACEKAIRSGAAQLVLLDSETSEATLKSFENLCKYAEVPILKTDPPGELGRMTGKPANKIFVITDENFANRLVCIYKEERAACSKPEV